MAAIATDFRDVLIICISAMIAAIFLIAGNGTGTTVVSAFVIVIRHIRVPQVPFKFY